MTTHGDQLPNELAELIANMDQIATAACEAADGDDDQSGAADQLAQRLNDADQQLAFLVARFVDDLAVALWRRYKFDIDFAPQADPYVLARIMDALRDVMPRYQQVCTDLGRDVNPFPAPPPEPTPSVDELLDKVKAIVHNRGFSGEPSDHPDTLRDVAQGIAPSYRRDDVTLATRVLEHEHAKGPFDDEFWFAHAVLTWLEAFTFNDLNEAADAVALDVTTCAQTLIRLDRSTDPARRERAAQERQRCVSMILQVPADALAHVLERVPHPVVALNDDIDTEALTQIARDILNDAAAVHRAAED